MGKILATQKSEERILFLAINEREKSLKLYESLLDSNDILDEHLREIFRQIAQKEREILTKTKEILNALDLGESSDCNASDLDKKDEILLPSALPEDILGELQREMGALDCKSLNILAMGVESHHLQTSDFLIKQTQNLCQNPKVLDMLYQLQALSYNHHIAQLQGELPKENITPSNPINPNANPADSANSTNFASPQNHANPANSQNSADSTNPALSNGANLSQMALQEVLRQNPLFGEIQTSISQIQHFYAETKAMVGKLEKGELQKDELVAFLQRLPF
ncbi:hypothetical protein [Helicobacter sp. T3_23-1056]